MLRKMFAFAILAIAAIGFAGCDSTSTETVYVQPEPIEGTYDVTYFGTSTLVALLGGNLIITDSCARSADFGVYTGTEICAPTNAFAGEIVVSSAADKQIKIISKMQMMGGWVEFSASDKFQYTEYYPVTPAANRLSGNGVGVYAFNMNETTAELTETSIDFATSPFEFYMTGDELTIKMTLKGKVTDFGSVDAVTTVKAKKRTKAVVAPSKTKFWDFKADGNLKGMYKIDLFAMNTEGQIITNDCAKTIANGFATINNCGNDNQTSKFEGLVAMDVDTTALFGPATMYAKVQMNGGIVENRIADKYQRMVFGSMPSTLSAKGMTLKYLTDAGVPSNVDSEYKESVFNVKTSADGKVLTIEATLKGKELQAGAKKVDVKYLIQATKDEAAAYAEPDNALLY